MLYTAALAATATSDVLIIGGTGLMGVPTAARLLEAGRRVVIMSRGKTQGQGTNGRRPAPPVGADILQCDRDDEDAFVAALCSPDCPRVVVDFTAMQTSQVQSIRRAHEKLPLAHYVFVSTNMAYPGGVERMDVSATDGRIAESAARLDEADDAPCNYGGNKLKCEALLHRYAAAATPLRSTVVRPPAVVGCGCDPRHEKLQRLVLGLLPLPETKARPPAQRPGRRFRVACADDVAQVIARIVDRPPPLSHPSAQRQDGATAQACEVFNVASGASQGYDLDEYVAALAAALGRPATEVPEAPEVRNYEKQGVLDTTRAEAELGFMPTPMSEWMAATVAWHAPLLEGCSS